MGLKRQITAARAMGAAMLLGRIEYLVLHVTSQCNARCRMCFNWDGMRARAKEESHSVSELVKLARSMRQLPQLTCSGGEPLLREDLPEIVQAFYEHSGTRFFSIPTNALRPDRVASMAEHFVNHCPDGFLNFCLPFHGVDAHFDDILGVPQAYKHFHDTWDVIQKLRARHANISCVLNFVMSKFNYGSWREALDRAMTDYADAPIGVAYARGLTHEREASDVPLDEYRAAQEYLRQHKRQSKNFNPYVVMFDTIGELITTVVADVAAGNRRDIGCHAGRRLLVVYENGLVYPCEMLEVVGIPEGKSGETKPEDPCLGNLHDFDYDMAALLRTERARLLTRWIARHECACTWECAIYNRTIHSPSEVLKLAAAMTRRAVKRSGSERSASEAEPGNSSSG